MLACGFGIRRTHLASRDVSLLGGGRRMSAEVVTHPAVGVEDRRRWLALAVIVTAQFMVVLDIAIVNVALPSIKTDLHFSQENLQWVITGYSIFFGGFLLLGGRLADLLGRRRLFIGGGGVVHPSAPAPRV